MHRFEIRVGDEEPVTLEADDWKREDCGVYLFSRDVEDRRLVVHAVEPAPGRTVTVRLLEAPAPPAPRSRARKPKAP